MSAMTTPPARTAVPRLTPSRLLVAVGNEVSKGLRHAWAERLQIIIELPFFAAFMLLLALLLGRGEEVAATDSLGWRLDPGQTTWVFLGFMTFSFVFFTSVKMFWRLMAEIQTGTLEQTYLSPLPAWLNIAAGRLVASLAETALVVAALTIITGLVADLQLAWNGQALAPILLVIVGGMGHALIIAGLTLAWKRVELLQEMLTGVIMFVSGAILPLSNMPGWLSSVAKPVFLTHAIAAMRTTLQAGDPIATWGTGGWVWLIVTAVAWLAAGIALFGAGSAVARRRGLTRY